MASMNQPTLHRQRARGNRKNPHCEKKTCRFGRGRECSNGSNQVNKVHLEDLKIGMISKETHKLKERGLVQAGGF